MAATSLVPCAASSTHRAGALRAGQRLLMHSDSPAHSHFHVLQLVRTYEQQLEAKQKEVLAFQDKYNIRIKVRDRLVGWGGGGHRPGCCGADAGDADSLGLLRCIHSHAHRRGHRRAQGENDQPAAPQQAAGGASGKQGVLVGQ